MPNFKKGSPEAKAYMAKLRAARGKTKPASKVGYKSDRLKILKVSSKLIKKYIDQGYNRKEAIEMANNEASYTIQSGKNISGAKTATKKSMATKKPSSMHKDTKSHNVNIRVVSGVKQLSGVPPHKAKYFIDFIYQGIERTEYFDKLPADRYKGMNGIIYVTRLTDYGTTLIPLTETKTNKPLKK
jgi:hypothetical protein